MAGPFSSRFSLPNRIFSRKDPATSDTTGRNAALSDSSPPPQNRGYSSPLRQSSQALGHWLKSKLPKKLTTRKAEVLAELKIAKLDPNTDQINRLIKEFDGNKKLNIKEILNSSGFELGDYEIFKALPDLPLKFSRLINNEKEGKVKRKPQYLIDSNRWSASLPSSEYLQKGIASSLKSEHLGRLRREPRQEDKPEIENKILEIIKNSTEENKLKIKNIAPEIIGKTNIIKKENCSNFIDSWVDDDLSVNFPDDKVNGFKDGCIAELEINKSVGFNENILKQKFLEFKREIQNNVSREHFDPALNRYESGNFDTHANIFSDVAVKDNVPIEASQKMGQMEFAIKGNPVSESPTKSFDAAAQMSTSQSNINNKEISPAPLLDADASNGYRHDLPLPISNKSLKLEIEEKNAVIPEIVKNLCDCLKDRLPLNDKGVRQLILELNSLEPPARADHVFFDKIQTLFQQEKYRDVEAVAGKLAGNAEIGEGHRSTDVRQQEMKKRISDYGKLLNTFSSMDAARRNMELSAVILCNAGEMKIKQLNDGEFSAEGKDKKFLEIEILLDAIEKIPFMSNAGEKLNTIRRDKKSVSSPLLSELKDSDDGHALPLPPVFDYQPVGNAVSIAEVNKYSSDAIARRKEFDNHINQFFKIKEDAESTLEKIKNIKDTYKNDLSTVVKRELEKISGINTWIVERATAEPGTKNEFIGLRERFVENTGWDDDVSSMNEQQLENRKSHFKIICKDAENLLTSVRLQKEKSDQAWNKSAIVLESLLLEKAFSDAEKIMKEVELKLTYGQQRSQYGINLKLKIDDVRDGMKQINKNLKEASINPVAGSETRSRLKVQLKNFLRNKNTNSGKVGELNRDAILNSKEFLALMKKSTKVVTELKAEIERAVAPEMRRDSSSQ
ncbi:DNA-directed RNA polymerase, omega subunit family protein [Oxalobacteraceae bacterium IMCC9480]|nr:DNA-directed RNA polymerase, omega subunit family protein [Oxalobacteraceae bacterium IMCC9480]NDP59560.1 hypothetical protein [Oxalobacteraceae bacterium]